MDTVLSSLFCRGVLAKAPSPGSSAPSNREASGFVSGDLAISPQSVSAGLPTRARVSALMLQAPTCHGL